MTTLVSFFNFLTLADLKSYHPGTSEVVGATVMGVNYPADNDFKVYMWSYWDNTASNDDTVVKPTAVDPSTGLPITVGRWLKIVTNTGLATVATTGSYTDLTNKPTQLSPISIGSPTSRTLSLATAYQATDNTKPAIITVNLNSTAALTLGGGTTIVGEVRIGSANTVSTGASGTAVGSYKNSLTGTLVVGIAINTESQQTISFGLPAGWFFSVRQTTGSGLSVVSAFDQSISN